jgi:lipopolysaccharide assembly protein A
MFSFIFLIVLALGFGYFATQNTQNVSVNFAGETLSHLPMYIVLVVTLFIGFILSWFNNLFDTIIAFVTISGNEKKIKEGKGTINDLTKRINQLEIENAKLLGRLDKEEADHTSL